MPSTPQVVPTVVLFDYAIGTDGKPLVNASVTVTLSQNKATVAAPQVNLDTGTFKTTTDSNGYWQVTVVSNFILIPAGTWYTVLVGSRSLRVALPTGAGPFQASLNLAP